MTGKIKYPMDVFHTQPAVGRLDCLFCGGGGNPYQIDLISWTLDYLSLFVVPPVIPIRVDKST